MGYSLVMRLGRTILTGILASGMTFGWGSLAASGQEGATSKPDIGTPAPGKGEQCLVCRKTIPPEMNAVPIEYRGRKFAVGEPFLDEFRGNPDKYFARLQPRGALFDETQDRPRPLASVWLWGGVYILIGLLAGGIAAYIAVHKHRPPLPWFFAGFLANVVGIVAVALASPLEATTPGGVPPGLRKVATTHSPAKCPHCGAANHPSATACSACGGTLEAKVQGEVTRT